MKLQQSMKLMAKKNTVRKESNFLRFTLVATAGVEAFRRLREAKGGRRLNLFTLCFIGSTSRQQEWQIFYVL